ncbi:DUF692 domain-containing protein [Ideonella sp. A 288]|uniref:DUF692 domain-containing protein n=1 Tax=Ideonella sp. A 288 TaxID=1962181 RepID=UPI001F346D2A|nr:DUF692 domain-containing protein [Ideonella sp. A 288]
MASDAAAAASVGAAQPAAPVGIGLRQPHCAEFVARRPPLGFVEVHSENYFADGGAALAVLHEVREQVPVSLHGVGLALGSAVGLDEWHLARLARLVDRIEPVRVSDHASFARAPRRANGPVHHASDLLPIATTPAALQLMVDNVQRVQERLRRPLLVEHLSAYLAWADEGLAEPEFFNRLARRSGCGLLLDVNNLVVNALNDGVDAVAAACAWIDALDPAIVGEIHLAGYKDCGDIVIDDHGSRVRGPVWQVYEHALRHVGAVPTLVEWDTDLPALDVLLDEAGQAGLRLQAAAAARVTR